MLRHDLKLIWSHSPSRYLFVVRPLDLLSLSLPHIETQAIRHFGARMLGVLWFVIQPFFLALGRQRAERQPVERRIDGPIRRTR